MDINLKEYTDNSYFIKEIEVNPNWIDDFNDDYYEYRRRWKKATEELYLYDFPLCLEIESSYNCNYWCPNCPRFAATIPKKGNMSLEIFRKIINECKKMKLDSIFLDHGGEALINKHLPEFVRLCYEANILDIMISTNASLLTRDLSRKLIQNGLTKINFSIDAATTKTYAATRPGGDYAKVLQNIEDFLEEKERNGKSYPRVRVSFIIQDSNQDEAEMFYEQWKVKANVIAFQKMKNYEKILGDNSHTPLNLTYDFKCTQLFTLLMIDYKGGIHFCIQDYNHKYTLGSIGKNKIKECWNADIIERLRDLHREGRYSEFSFCKNCVLGSL